MHEIVFIPAAVFSAVAGVSWAIALLIEQRQAPAPAVARPVAPGFHPVVIEGGRNAAPYRRRGQIQLAFARAAAHNDNAVRAFGG